MIVAKPQTPMALVGPDALASALSRSRSLGQRLMVLVDAAASDQVNDILARARSVPTEHVVISRHDDDALIDPLAERARESVVDGVFGIGGGQVMDLAKLVRVEAAGPGSLRPVRRKLRVRGHTSIPDTTHRQPELTLCPTTIGTGSQASAAAVLRIDDAGCATKGLVTSLLFVADQAVYDPALLEEPQSIYDSGLLEILARLLVPYVSQHASTVPRANRDAMAQLAELGGLIVRRSPLDALDAAILGGESHAGWSLRGRGNTPSMLWFVAMELSAATGITKNQATAALLPTWIDRVLSGYSAWGDRDRLEQALVATGNRDQVNHLCASATRDIGYSVDIPVVAAATVRRWRGGTAFRDVGARDVESLLESAVGEQGGSWEEARVGGHGGERSCWI